MNYGLLEFTKLAFYGFIPISSILLNSVFIQSPKCDYCRVPFTKKETKGTHAITYLLPRPKVFVFAHITDSLRRDRFALSRHKNPTPRMAAGGITIAVVRKEGTRAPAIAVVATTYEPWVTGIYEVGVIIIPCTCFI